MAAKYIYEFKGQDDILNRVEIHDSSTVTATNIQGGSEPFTLEYDEKDKLEVIRAAGAKMQIVSESNLQFLDLHTDDMQKYMVKIFRAGALYWIGWLDSELYSEQLTDATPYMVDFTASDFNILERLKFISSDTTKYTDIAPLMTQLRRCLNRLGLPFSKIYISCTTSVEGIELETYETPLHRLYIQSANFYDEDGEAEKCNKVIEGILKPFGLMMVQVAGNIYIYDYNAIKLGVSFMRYDYATLVFEAIESINLNFGDVDNIGFAGKESSLEFEELVNNLKITSSLYGSYGDVGDEVSVEVEDLSEVIDLDIHPFNYSRTTYAKCDGWFNDYRFFLFIQIPPLDSSLLWKYQAPIMGADILNDGTDRTLYTIKPDVFLFGTDGYYLTLNAEMYINNQSVNNGPFYTASPPPDKDKATSAILMARIYSVDDAGNTLMVFNDDLTSKSTPTWDAYAGTKPYTGIFFSASSHDSYSTLFNAWSSAYDCHGFNNKINPSACTMSDNTGFRITLDGVKGKVVIEITNVYKIFKANWSDLSEAPVIWSGTPKDIFIDKISSKIVDSKGDTLSVDDIEFSSYINTKSKSDKDNIGLICVTANEDSYPITKGSILVPDTDSPGAYKCQLAFSRSGQTDILERLLTCSYHSNYSTKKKVIGVTLRGCINPALQKITYNNLFDSEFLTKGCTIDFAAAKTSITASEFSEDTAKLSDIEYV